MSASSVHRIFVSHAWQEHIDHEALTTLLDDVSGFEYIETGLSAWRSSKAKQAEEPNEEVHRSIGRADVVVVLAAMYWEERSRAWLRYEIEHAQRLAKPVTVLTPYGTSDLPRALGEVADKVVPASRNDWRVWDVHEIVSAITQLKGDFEGGEG